MLRANISIEPIVSNTPDTIKQRIIERHRPPFKGQIYNILNKPLSLVEVQSNITPQKANQDSHNYYDNKTNSAPVNSAPGTAALANTVPGIIFFSKYDKENCLEYACQHSNTTLARWLLKYMEFSSAQRRGALKKACEYGNLETVKLFKENIAGSTNSSLIELACKGGNAEVVKYLILSLNLSKIISSNDTLFIVRDACEEGYLTIAKLITDLFNIKLKDLKGVGLSMLNIYKDGHIETFKWLIKLSEKNGTSLPPNNEIYVNYEFNWIVENRKDFEMARWMIDALGWTAAKQKI